MKTYCMCKHLLYILLLIISAPAFIKADNAVLLNKYTNSKNAAATDSIAVDSLFKWIYIIYTKDAKLADSLSSDFLNYSKQHPDNMYLKAKANLLKGYVLDGKGYSVEMIHYLTTAINSFNKDIPSINLCFAYQVLAGAYERSGNYDLANNAGKKGLQMAELLNNNVLINNSYSFLGINYNIEKKHEEAKKMFMKLIPINEKANNKRDLTKAYLNTGTSYRNLEKYDSALYYNQKGLDIAIEENNWYNIAYGYNDIGSIYLRKTEYEKAISYLQKAEQIRKENDEADELAWTYMFLGDCYTGLKRYTDATKTYNKVVALALQNSNKKHRSEAYQRLAEMYHDYKKLDSAYFYHNKYIVLKDSIVQEEGKMSTEALIASYQLEEKEKNIQLLNEKERTSRLEVQQHRTILLIAIAGIVVLLFVLFIVIRLRKQRIAKLTLEAQLAEEAAKRSAIEILQKEKERISRDLHDNVGGQLSYVLYSLEDLNHENVQTRSEVSKDVSSSVRNIISNLRETIWAINDEEISINDLSDRLKVYARNMFKNSKTKVRFAEDIKSDKKMISLTGLNLYRICQEIINNSFKHAKAEELIITINSAETITIIIKDNGKGFNIEGSKNNGFGLSNIKSRADETGIKLNLQSEESKGTIYTLIVHL